MIVNEEKTQCNNCYQGGSAVCEKKGTPRRLVNTVLGTTLRLLDPGISEQECFYHVCGVGVKSAVDQLRHDKSNATLLPVATKHKPFIDGVDHTTGRYVVKREGFKGFQKGDVIIEEAGKMLRLTNARNFRPLKCNSER